MSKLIGLVLVAAGFGFAFEMFPLSTFDSAAPPSTLVRAAPGGASATAPLTTASLPASATRQPRMFAPDQPLHASPSKPSAASSNGLSAGPVAVPREQRSPVDLARELQSELRRVGCYAGDVDGDWGPGSRRAMQSFTERVNSTLPTDAPDLVLLSLVRGHGEQTCSAECATGQIMSSRGQCVRAGPAITATAPANGWQPVVRVASRPVTAPVRTGGTTAGVASVRPAAAAPLVTSPPVPAAGVPNVATAPLDTANRQIDWGTRMSIGAPATPLDSARSPLSPPAIAATPVALPPPEAVTPALRTGNPVRSERQRPASSPSNYVNRPAYIDRPRPRSNWKRDVFVSRN